MLLYGGPHGGGMTDIVMQLQAMSLTLPDTPDHPNKAPFTGILTRVGQPSDEPPGGAQGKRVLLTEAAARHAIPTLLGMAIDYTPDLGDHDPKAKIGIITSAEVVGDAITIAGFFYASDFPDVVKEIKAKTDILGFSFEADRILVEDPKADPLVILQCVFTGAAVLRQDRAAYHSTSLAASAAAEEEKVMKEELEKITAALAAITDRLGKVEASTTAITAAAGVMDRVKPHVDALMGAADAMERDGLGADPRHGHVARLRHMASCMTADAAMGKMPHIYNDHSWQSDFRSAAVPDQAAIAAAAAATKEVADLKDQLASFGTVVKDMKAAAELVKPEPARKTLAPAVTAALSKLGLEAEGDGKIKASALDDALGKSNLNPQQRLQLKVELRNGGLLAAS